MPLIWFPRLTTCKPARHRDPGQPQSSFWLHFGICRARKAPASFMPANKVRSGALRTGKFRTVRAPESVFKLLRASDWQIRNPLELFQASDQQFYSPQELLKTSSRCAQGTPRAPQKTTALQSCADPNRHDRGPTKGTLRFGPDLLRVRKNPILDGCTGRRTKNPACLVVGVKNPGSGWVCAAVTKTKKAHQLQDKMSICSCKVISLRSLYSS